MTPSQVCQKSPTFSCYKKELTTLTQQSSPKEAFDLIKNQYSSVPYVKSQCHQLAHVVGRVAYEKYQNLSETFSAGDKYCWSGYYHGAIEELTKVKGYNYIVKNSNSVCKEIATAQPHSFYHYNCVHGLGHGFMLVLEGNLFKSLSSCDSLTDDWERTSCYGGVFMQNIMNEQGPDADSSYPAAYLKPDQPMYPCTVVDKKYKDQCYLMQTSYALQTVNYDFQKVFMLCSNVEPEYIETCYRSLGRDASGTSISDVHATKNNCLLGPTLEAQAYCIDGAVRDFISYFHSDKQAYELCNSVPEDLQLNCRAVAKSYYATF